MKRDWKLNTSELENALKIKRINNWDKKWILELMHLNNGYTYKMFTNSQYKIHSLDEGKELFLKKLKNDFEEYGKDFIDYIIELRKLNINLPNDRIISINDIDTIADLSLEIFSNYSNKLYKCAKSIIDNKQVLVIDKSDFVSFEIYLNSLKKAFCVIDKCNSSYVFIHELEHALEETLKLRTQYYYPELGSILFETFFIDELVKCKVVNANMLYYERLNDIDIYLDELFDYFNILLIAKKKNFNLSNHEFTLLLTEAMGIEEDEIPNYIEDEISNDNVNEMIMYLTSYIKSLEVRNIIKNDKKLIMNYLDSSKETINLNTDQSIESIKKFVKEIKRNES